MEVMQQRDGSTARKPQESEREKPLRGERKGRSSRDLLVDYLSLGKGKNGD